MPRPEPLANLPRYPVTALVSAAAVVVTVVSMHDSRLVEPFLMDERAFTTEPWRLVFSALPHVGMLHLVFNLYWTWTLGAMLERSFGHAAFLGFLMLAAAFSSAAEWALDAGGVGLSGVGYAMFGVLWALRKHPRYAGMMDSATAKLFAAWFVLCIIATRLNYMNVGNIAHGAGALIGFLVGCAVRSPGAARAAWSTVVLALCGLSYLGGTTLRPHLRLANFGLGGPREHIELATDAIRDSRHADAVKHIRAALKSEPENAQWWGVLAQQLALSGDVPAAKKALERAIALEPGNAGFLAERRTIEHAPEVERLLRSATKAVEEDRHADAVRDLSRLVEIDPRNAAWWASLGVQQYYDGDLEAAQASLEKTVGLDPGNRQMVEFLQQIRTATPPTP